MRKAKRQISLVASTALLISSSLSYFFLITKLQAMKHAKSQTSNIPRGSHCSFDTQFSIVLFLSGLGRNSTSRFFFSSVKKFFFVSGDEIYFLIYNILRLAKLSLFPVHKVVFRPVHKISQPAIFFSIIILKTEQVNFFSRQTNNFSRMAICFSRMAIYFSQLVKEN